MGSRDRAKAVVVTSVSTGHLCLRPIVRQSVQTSRSKLIWMEFQMRSDPFRLKSTERSCGLRNLPLSGECSRAALRFNIEDIVPIEIEAAFSRNLAMRRCQANYGRHGTRQGVHKPVGRKLNEINGLQDLRL